jgi:hypothetical protein
VCLQVKTRLATAYLILWTCLKNLMNVAKKSFLIHFCWIQPTVKSKSKLKKNFFYFTFLKNENENEIKIGMVKMNKIFKKSFFTRNLIVIYSFFNPATSKEHTLQIYPPLSHFDHLVLWFKTTVLAPSPSLVGDLWISTTEYHFGAIIYLTSLLYHRHL